MMEQNDNIGLLQQFNLTPPMLQRRVVVNIGVAIIFAVATIILAVAFKTPGFLVGLLIALYIGYLGIDILVGCRNGTIRSEKMVIVKASRIMLTKMVNLVLREANGTEEDGKRHGTRLEVTRGDINMLTTGTVLNVCFRGDGEIEILAWEIYG